MVWKEFISQNYVAVKWDGLEGRKNIILKNNEMLVEGLLTQNGLTLQDPVTIPPNQTVRLSGFRKGRDYLTGGHMIDYGVDIYCNEEA